MDTTERKRSNLCSEFKLRLENAEFGIPLLQSERSKLQNQKSESGLDSELQTLNFIL